MDLHSRLILQAKRHVRTASAVAAVLGSLSLLVSLRTWSERGYIDFQIIFGIADAVVVLALAGWLRMMRMPPAVMLIGLGVLGIGYGVREGIPLLAAVPSLVGIGFYARAVSALRYLGSERSMAATATTEIPDASAHPEGVPQWRSQGGAERR